MSARTPPTTPDAWRQAVLDYITGHPDRPLKPRALARELRISTSDYTRFRNLLRGLLDDGAVVLGAGRTLRLPLQTGQIAGVFRAHRRGFGFIERPGYPALFVEASDTGGALDGDTVAARLVRERGRGRGRGPRAQVVRVLQRAARHGVGLLEGHGARWIVRPLGRDPLPPVQIDDPTAHGSRPGDLVVVEPDEHAARPRHLHGRIVERLGDPRHARPWILAAIRRREIPDRFPPRVLLSARQAAARFEPQNLDGREDLRDLLTVTIDPPDARDFDDAISMEPLAGRRVRLGVHIADVAHFVPPGGPVDLEARARGTSVYFPGVAVPMLPESLSNDVCCLRPGQPRLTKSVFLTYDGAARVVETRFASSVICSAFRLTYQQVTAALAGDTDELSTAVAHLLHGAAELAERIRRRRLAAGMISLCLPEVEIRIGDDDRVVDSGPADTGFSHTIIEMFMVEANEAVSRALTNAGFDHLRRVHPEPDPTAAEALSMLTSVLGHAPPASLSRSSIQSLLNAVRGQPAEQAVNYVLLRALAQAAYSPAPEGHFALASDDYCHFTSPIRRYSDLTVHRLFDSLVTPQPSRRGRHDDGAPPQVDLVELGGALSATERRAQQAEREATSSLLLLLMKGKLGEALDGIVTGVLPFGVFVQVRPYMAEGVVRASDFGPDEWLYDRQGARFVGRHSGRTVHLGLAVRVQIAAVDQVRQELALVPESAVKFGASPPSGAKAKRVRGGKKGPHRSSGWKKRGHQGP